MNVPTKSLPSLPLLATLPLLLLTACSSSSDADADAAPSKDLLSKSCQRYAEVVTRKRAACPLEPVDLDDSDEAISHLARTCEALFGAPGSDAAGAKMQACTDHLRQASCTEFHADTAPACAAMFKGQLATDESCLFDSQCESGLCRGLSSYSCGTCRAPANIGEACGTGSTDVLCADGLICLANTSTTGTCEPIEIERQAPDDALGRRCEYDSDCSSEWLTCYDDRCQERWQQPCSVDLLCKPGQRCDRDTETCVEAQLGAAGDACDYDHHCGPTLYCSAGTVCRSRIPEGGRCEYTSSCRAGLTCTDNLCAVPVIDDYDICE